MPRFTNAAAAGTLILSALGGVALACSAPASATGASYSRESLIDLPPAQSAVGADIAQLHRALAPFHKLEEARAASWPLAVTSCWFHQGLGAMGYHYGDPQRFDATIDPLRPEVLLYEPLAGGKFKLVAAEFIVPFQAWTDSAPPRAFGQEFVRDERLGIYALHVWTGRENPAGLFAPWNPKVSCDHAAESEDRGSTH